MTKLPDGPALCPSAPGTPGAALIGVVQGDGRVAHLGTPLPVDTGFLDAARVHGSPERRFRFSSACVGEGCTQWDGHGCGLIDRILGYVTAAGALDPTGSLRPCPIRGGCRWWRQRGATACAVCPLVVTDAGPPAKDVAPASLENFPG